MHSTAAPTEQTLHESIYARLRAALTYKNAPSVRALAWADYREEWHVERGWEGLTGPLAAYHLTVDVPRLLKQAAETLAGRVGPGESKRARDQIAYAIDAQATALGWRYIRGTEGLVDALKAAKVTPSQLQQFLTKRENFLSTFMPLLDAAWVANKYTPCREPVEAALRMFIAEMHTLSDWRARIGSAGEVAIMREYLADAEDALNDRQGGDLYEQKG